MMKGKILTEEMAKAFEKYLRRGRKERQYRKKISAGYAGVRRIPKWCGSN